MFNYIFNLYKKLTSSSDEKCLINDCNELKYNSIKLCKYHYLLFRNLIKRPNCRKNDCYYTFCKNKPFKYNFCKKHLDYLNKIKKLKSESKLCKSKNCVNKKYHRDLCKKHYLLDKTLYD